LLQNIRDRATGWIAYVIVIGISIPFALWGIDQYFTGGNIIVAEVNDTKISAERLNGEYQDRLREMQSIISKDQDEAELQKKIIKRTVLDELIDSVIVREFVNENKFQISEQSLIKDIRNNKIFHSNNKFSSKIYKALLDRQGIKTTDYERIRKSELKTLQFYNNIVQSSFIPSQNIKLLKQLKYQTRNFKILSLSYNDFINDKEVFSEDQKKDFFVKYKNIFAMPEKININYIIFEKDKLKDSIKIGDKDLLNFYNENKYKYVIPEKRNVSQIFLSNKKSSKEENKAKIFEISEKLTSNLNFSDLAEEYSNDELSKDKGGNIGWITSKDLSGELSNSIFSIANIGDVSKILETEQGFYIFKLIDIKDSKIKKFDDIKNNLRKDYKNIQISRKYEVLYEDLANILFENPNSLDKVEQYLSVKKISTGLLTLPQIKSQHKIFSDPKVLAVLSSPSVSNDNLNSEPIEIMDKIIMFRVSEKSKKEYKKYKEVENEILSLLKTEKSIENMKNSIKDIEEKVRKGKPLSEIEKMVNKKFTSYNSIERDDDSIPPSILDKVFSLNLKNNVTSIESGTGNYELIFLDSIDSGETDLSQKSINTMFNNDQVNSLLYAVIQSMRDKSNIKIYSENL
tara:strand:- start:384 stop:2267 length:1884 start_codon:yes stop_codon:yes gene_type:complete